MQQERHRFASWHCRDGTVSAACPQVSGVSQQCLGPQVNSSQVFGVSQQCVGPQVNKQQLFIILNFIVGQC